MKKFLLLFLFLNSFCSFAQNYLDRITDEYTIQYLDSGRVYYKMKEDTVNHSSRLKILFAGDLMIHQPMLEAAYDPFSHVYNFHPLFRFINPIVHDADLAVLNLETTFGGRPYEDFPDMSAPDTLAAAIRRAGFDFVMTANNHAGDRDKKGLDRTIDILDQQGLMHTGTFKDSVWRDQSYPALVEMNGFKVALLNYTYGMDQHEFDNAGNINVIDTKTISSDLKNAKRLKADLTVIYLHWGYEYQRQASSRQRYFARYCIENGADLVIGSNPLVVQPIENVFFEKDGRIKKGLVVYSLGNLASSYRKHYTDGGIMFALEISRDSLNEVVIDRAGYIPTWVYIEKKDDNTEYYVLPVSKIEEDSTVMPLNSSAQSKMNLFANDTRELMKRNDIIKEILLDSLSFASVRQHLLKLPYIDWNSDSLGMNENDFQDSLLMNDNIRFRIQIFASKKYFELKDNRSEYLKSVSIEQTSDGIYRYVIGDFSSYDEANAICKSIRQSLYKDAFVCAYRDNQRIDLEKTLLLLKP